MPKAFRKGDIVRVVQSGGSKGDLGPAAYVYVSADKSPYYCWIREAGTAPNGKTYAVQRWMPDALAHCPDEARLNKKVRDIKTGKTRKGPALLARLLPRL